MPIYTRPPDRRGVEPRLPVLPRAGVAAVTLRPPLLLDGRSELDVLAQLLATGEGAFADLPAEARWRWAQAIPREQLRAMLAEALPDAGLMLALIFARMMSLGIERLNRVPTSTWWRCSICSASRRSPRPRPPHP
jgi:hypothetical protein